jgi:membrane associated rhomboid family serine protease
MEALGIVLLCVGAAAVYGILHDQVTARVCVEYFTVGHVRIFDTTDPTLLGLGWGVLATWWVGLLLGVALAIAARSGSRPLTSARSLVRPVGVVLMVMAGASLVAGLVGGGLAHAGVVTLGGPIAEAVPPDRHARFIADHWAHVASYLAGLVGGLVLVNRVWQARKLREIRSRRAPA